MSEQEIAYDSVMPLVRNMHLMARVRCQKCGWERYAQWTYGESAGEKIIAAAWNLVKHVERTHTVLELAGIDASNQWPRT